MEKVKRTPGNVKKFLKKNRVYIKFVKLSSLSIEEYLSTLPDESRLVGSAFYWHDTKDGAEYWQALQSKASHYFIDEGEF